MKKIIIILLMISVTAAPAYAMSNQNPVKKIIGKVASFFRENPVAKQRDQIQKDYDDGKISQEEYENRLSELDGTQEAYKELSRRLAEERAQAAEQQAAK